MCVRSVQKTSTIWHKGSSTLDLGICTDLGHKGRLNSIIAIVIANGHQNSLWKQPCVLVRAGGYIASAFLQVTRRDQTGLQPCLQEGGWRWHQEQWLWKVSRARVSGAEGHKITMRRGSGAASALLALKKLQKQPGSTGKYTGMFKAENKSVSVPPPRGVYC